MLKRFKLATVILTLILSSCIDQDYDMKDVDLTVQIGGEGLAFPLGKTDSIRVRTLLGDIGGGLIKRLDDGSYAFSMADSIDFADALPDFRKAIIIKGALNKEETIYIAREDLIPVLSSFRESESLRTSAPQGTPSFRYILDHTIPVNIDIRGANDIISLDTIMVENAFINLEFDIGLMADADMHLKVTFPETYIFKEGTVTSENVFETDVRIIDGKHVMDPPLELLALNFQGRGFAQDGVNQEFGDEILLNCTIDLDPTPIIVEIPTNLTILLKTRITDFSPTYAKGVVDLKIEKIHQTLILEGIPEFLRSEDCVLDLLEPSISFQLNSNAGLPVIGELSLVPYVGSKEVQNAKQKIAFALPISQSPEIIEDVNYVIAETNPNPNTNAHIFIKSETLSRVFKRIPDSIVVFMDGRLDLNISHTIDFKADYIAELKYDLEVPFVFGDEFNIALRDTIADIPSVLSDMLNESGLELFGEIENSLPLQLKLQMSALDENNKLIQLITTANTIKSASSGNSVKSRININLKKKDTSLKSNISVLVMNFTVTSEDSSGIPIDDGDFLIADLKVMLPNGVTINLNDTTD